MRLESIKAAQEAEDFVSPLDAYYGSSSTTLSLFGQQVNAEYSFSFDKDGEYFHSSYVASLSNIGEIHGENWIYKYDGEHGNSFIIEASDSLSLLDTLLQGEIVYSKTYNRYDYVDGKFEKVVGNSSSYSQVLDFAKSTYSYEFGLNAMDTLSSEEEAGHLKSESYAIGETTIHADISIDDGGSNIYDMSFKYESNLGLGYTKKGKINGTETNEIRSVIWDKDEDPDYPDLSQFSINEIEESEETSED